MLKIGTVSVRDRIEGDLGALAIDEAISKLSAEVEDRTVRQAFASTGTIGAPSGGDEY